MNKKFDMDPEAQAARKRQRLAMRVNRLPAPVKAQKPMTSQPANHEIAGYMPGRLEFETEYENEAEQAVKDMIFSEEDTPEEVGKCYPNPWHDFGHDIHETRILSSLSHSLSCLDLKLMVLEIYNAKLSKRMERRKFVF